MAIYSITPDIIEVDEGGSVVFTVDVTDGSTSTYGVTIKSGTSTFANATDFSDVFGLWGDITLPDSLLSGVVTFTKTMSTNTTTPPEGPEFFIVQLRENNTSGAVLAVTQNIVIVDTPISIDPHNGMIGAVSNDNSKPAFYFNGNWYKITGTAIPL
jgi:hypothetical protein